MPDAAPNPPGRSGSPAHDHQRRRRRGRPGLLAAGLVVLAGFGAATSVAQAALVTAPAGTKHTAGGGGGGSGNPEAGTDPPAKDGTLTTNDTGPASQPAGCANYAWRTPPRIVVHQAEFATGGGTLPDQVRMNNAIGQVVEEFNQTGGTSAAVSRVETSSQPFGYTEWFGDSTPTIHVGFASAAKFATYPDGDDGAAITLPSPFRGSDCTYKEMHIVVRDPASMTWNFGTPFTTWHDPKQTDYAYYDAGPKDIAGKTWFRPSFLHELLHAFGFQHTLTQYSFMNHRNPGGFPWANRAEDDSVRPLPDEVGTLRKLYPASDTRYDVAVLNTWFAPPVDDDDAASQTKLCTPSLGSAWSPATSDGPCGVNGSNVVCTGDTLRTRYALANYSTTSMQVAAYLWFSKDEQWDEADAESSSTNFMDLDKATSALAKTTWTVPDLDPGVQYHPVIRLISERLDLPTGAADGRSVRTDTIPLRGTLTAGSSSYCDSRG